jgi:hypothetical protein
MSGPDEKMGCKISVVVIVTYAVGEEFERIGSGELRLRKDNEA